MEDNEFVQAQLLRIANALERLVEQNDQALANAEQSLEESHIFRMFREREHARHEDDRLEQGRAKERKRYDWWNQSERVAKEISEYILAKPER
jgi:hypothetical protein